MHRLGFSLCSRFWIGEACTSAAGSFNIDLLIYGFTFHRLNTPLNQKYHAGAISIVLLVGTDWLAWCFPFFAQPSAQRRVSLAVSALRCTSHKFVATEASRILYIRERGKKNQTHKRISEGVVCWARLLHANDSQTIKSTFFSRSTFLLALHYSFSSHWPTEFWDSLRLVFSCCGDTTTITTQNIVICKRRNVLVWGGHGEPAESIL